MGWGKRLAGAMRRRVAGRLDRLAGPWRRPWRRPFPPAATHADIYHCFRLLLGRNPHREEWPGHAGMAGSPLPAVVGSYLNSLEFSRRGLLLPVAPAQVGLATYPGFTIHADADDPAVGRHVLAGRYEPEVAAAFRGLLRPGMGVIDIGANIGIFALLAASLVGREGFVLAFEPNPRNARLLEASRRRNGFAALHLVQAAAAPETGLLALHRSHSTGTATPPAEALEALLASETVAGLAPDLLVPAGRRIDLIKVDVDGGEYLALRGCLATIRRDRPAIVCEFVPGLLAGISGIGPRAFLEWLGGLGYEVAVIAPDGGSVPLGQRWDEVLAAQRARGTDHIDLLATPRGARAA